MGTHLFRGLCLACLGCLTIVLALSRPAQAQLYDGSVQPLQNFQPSDGYDPFNPGGTSSVTPGIMNVIQGLSQDNMTSGQFQEEQNQDLGTAAARFRAQQQKLLNQTTTPEP